MFFSSLHKSKEASRKTHHRHDKAKPEKANIRSSTTYEMANHRAFLLRDGKLPGYANYQWAPGDLYTQDGWTGGHQTFDHALSQINKTDQCVAKLEDSVNGLKSAHSDYAKKQDAQARKQEECLAEVRKLHRHFEVEEKKKEEEEYMRYWQQNLGKTHADGRRVEEEKAVSSHASRTIKEEGAAVLCAIRKEWEVEKERLHMQQLEEARRKAEDHATELRALRADLRAERRKASERRLLEARRRTGEKERLRWLGDRLVQERVTREAAQKTFEPSRDPYFATNTTPFCRERSMGYAEEYAPWAEGNVEEARPMSRAQESLRTPSRSVNGRPYGAWDYW
ncbi:hypothetical protein SUNI508_05311 [Seiridium unicorne]|uniref:Trichoplein keratin filament-binding protein n=1 Tax=Seiridium unicorne TaxID=138068 RepID=A0ABR2V575_9PEZI